MRYITTIAVLLGSLCTAAMPPAYAQHQAQHTNAIPSHELLPSLPPELEKIRAALDKYKDPIVAVHDGYHSTVGCVAFPQGGGAGQAPYRPGAMGVHFLNLGLIGPNLDPLSPQLLIYEPVGDQLRLVAAEWFVPLATGIKERPQLFGQAFWGPMEGHHPMMPVQLHHYDLHVWLWKQNPYGLFSATNPDVNCPPGPYNAAHVAPKLLPEQQP